MHRRGTHASTRRAVSPSPASVNVPGAFPERLQQELNRFLRELARRQPLLLFFDDLHWADESTVALLAFLVHRFATDSARILIVAAYRPSIIVAGLHPLLGVTPELRSRGAFREIAVDALSRLEIEQYLSKRFVKHRLSPGLVDAVHKATEGNPLFVVDLVTDLLRRGIVSGARWHMGGGARTSRLELRLA